MNCRICSKTIEFHYTCDDQMRQASLCFFCFFWWKKVEWHINGDVHEGNRVARILNNHYIIHPDQPVGTPFVGYGGKEFVIKFYDGTEVTTHNLWHQGVIPERFRKYLPNNAEFVDSRITCKCRKKFFPEFPGQDKCMVCILQSGVRRW